MEKRVKDIVPEIKRYAAQRIGGAEVIRTLRDTLSTLGLKQKKRNIPYKIQKQMREEEKKEEEKRREDLREQGIIVRKKKNRKEALRKKKTY